MKAKELIFTKIVECPYPGCKRGFFCDDPSGSEYICPEHRKHFSPVFEDEKGKRYRLVQGFGMSKRVWCKMLGNECPKDKTNCQDCDIQKSIMR